MRRESSATWTSVEPVSVAVLAEAVDDLALSSTVRVIGGNDVAEAI